MGKTRAEISRDWRKNNPERHKELYTKYYRRDREKVRKRQSEWRKDNPNYRGGNRVGYQNSPKGWAKYKLSSLRRNAKSRGIECTITSDDIQDIIVDKCPVLGIPLNYGLLDGKSKMLNNSPSVDRIDNSKGYIKGNIIIVSSLINRVKSTLLLEDIPDVMGKIIEFYKKYINDNE